MARATPIHTAGQTEYRAREDCSTDRARQADAPVEYRAQGHRIERIGSGWRVFDRTPGAPMAPDEIDELRAVMVGADPRTGQKLATRKTKVSAAAKLPAGPMLHALHAQGVTLPSDSWSARRVARMQRGLARDAEHAVPVRDLEKVARQTGITIEAVYPAGALAEAREHADDREQAGARGWDITFDCPKSVSTLYALSDTETARRIEEVYVASVRDAMAAVEEWTAYGQRGWHGNGRTARRIETHGLTGSLTLHTTARPVDGTADPHLHAHVMISALVQGVDGQWGVLGAGGRELYRHVPAAGQLLRARLRERLTDELGVAWEQDSHTGAWEVAGVPRQVRDLYSRRRDQAVTRAGDGATPAARRLAARRSAAAKLHGGAGNRAEWVERARQADVDPAAVVNGALGRHRADEVQEESPEERITRVAAGVWGRRPVSPTSHADLIGETAHQMPHGAPTHVITETARGVAARSVRAGGSAGASSHMRHADRWQAPPLTVQEARRGQGPAAAASKTIVARLRAARTLAQTRADAASREAQRLAAIADAGHLAAWRAGMTLRRVRADLAQAQTQASAARQEERRLEAAIPEAITGAVRADVAMATAQERARAALQRVRQRAAARAALQAARLPNPPQPRRPRRGIPPPSYRPRPPTRGPGREGPSL